MWDFAGVAPQDWHPARERLHEHSAELLLPPGRSLARHAEEVHRVEEVGGASVSHVRDDPGGARVAVTPGSDRSLEWAAADEQGSPWSLHALERSQEERDSFLRDETAEVTDDGRSFPGPAELATNGLACRGVGAEGLKIDSEGDRTPRSVAPPRTIRERSHDRLSAPNPAPGAREAVALEDIEWKWVPLFDVLAGQIDEARPRSCPPGYLSSGEHERFFPAMEHVPGLAEEVSQLPTEKKGVRRARPVSAKSDQGRGFRRFRSQDERCEVAMEESRRRDGYIPIAPSFSGDRLREAAIQRNRVRMPNREEAQRSSSS